MNTEIIVSEVGTQVSNINPVDCEEVIPGVLWGKSEKLFTPAFWASQASMCDVDSTFRRFKLGSNLIEEVAACILGGYGMPSELGSAAFDKVRASGLLTRKCTSAELEEFLTIPMEVNGRVRKYRFHKQKARYLADAIDFLASCRSYPLESRAFRNFLLEIPGIGYKTASWITRNWLGSDEVAIIDIHILRAGIAAGIFPKTSVLPRDYLILEERFIGFAKAINCKPSSLDNFMWNTMKRIGILLKHSGT